MRTQSGRRDPEGRQGHEVSMFLAVGSYYLGKYRGNFFVPPELLADRKRRILLRNYVLMDSPFCLGAVFLPSPISILVD